jgi:hypothetical protein
LPNCRSICVNAVSAAFNLSVGIVAMSLLLHRFPLWFARERHGKR